MKIQLLFLIFLLNTTSYLVKAQIINQDAFLQGKYIELAMNDCGCFGSGTRRAPLGYNPNAFNGTLGFVADPEKDGWNTGTPNRCGDYFQFGLPYEGWYLQVGNKIYQNGDGCSLGNQNIFSDGKLFNYRKDSVVAAEWEGTKDSIYVHKKVSFKENALFFIVEVEIENRSKAELKDIFYMRTVDADNEAVITNDPQTINTIVYQARFGDSRVLASAVGKQYGCYLGLGTKDCRAKASTGIVPNREPKNAWNGMPSSRRMSGSETSDTEICISYKLQNLKPGGKATLAYTYVLEQSLLDLALEFVEPKLLAQGVDISTKLEATTCLNSPIVLEIQNEGNYEWTWSPNTEIDTTRGRKVTITPSRERTYTVKGYACDTIEAQFTIKVRADTAKPVISCPSDQTVYLPQNSCSMLINYPQPTFSDDCTGEKITRRGRPSGSTFNRGVHTIHYKIEDRAKKTDSCSFKITVLDTIGPRPNCKDLVYFQQKGSCLTTINYPLSFATDNCTGLIYSLTDGIGSGGRFPVGQTKESYTISDSSGNSTTCSFMIRVIDTIAPTISHPIRVIGRTGSPVFFTVKASDECDSVVALTQLAGRPSGSTYDTAGVYTQTFTAVDRYANRSTVSFEVVINTPPKIEDQVFSVLENAPIGTILGKVEASDADGDDIALRILSGNTGNTFRINPVTGILSILNDRLLNYETNSVFKLSVEAIDGGPGNLRDTALVKVLVLDENEPPTAIELSNRFVKENQPVGTFIGELNTVDQDSFDIYEQYELVETANFPDNQFFSISPPNRLVSNFTFDFEKQNEYLVKIASKAKNSNDSLTDTFRIFIVNLNDIPTVSGFFKVTNANLPILLERKDFDKEYFDQDGEALNGIRLSQLPKHGSLRLAGDPVFQGDSIFPFLLPKLVYLPEKDYIGEDEFLWQASDNRSLSLLTKASIRINPTLQAFAGEDKKSCNDQSVRLGGEPSVKGGTPPYRYIWRPRVELSSDAEPNPTAKPMVSVSYFLTVVDSLGQRAFDTVRVNVGKLEGIALSKAKWEIIDGDRVFISVFAKDTALLAQWNPTQGVENPNALSGFFSPTLQDPNSSQTFSYVLTLSNKEGCSLDLNLEIEVLPKINIPNGFSPNGDGINDVWVIRGIEAYSQNRVEIYDRYGQKVLVQKGYNRQNAWDGRLDGKLLPFGSYFYVVELGKLGMRYTGSITILE